MVWRRLGALGLLMAGLAGAAPVVFRGERLFDIEERSGSFLPEDRARALVRRMARLAGDAPQPIGVVDRSLESDVVSRGEVLVAVNDADAARARRPRPELAAEWAKQIEQAVARAREDSSARRLRAGLAFTAGATVILLVLLVALSRAFPLLYAKCASWRGTRIRSWRLQQMEVLSEERIVETLLAAARLARLLLTLGLLYAYLSLVFGFFPATRGYAAALLAAPLEPLRLLWTGAVASIPGLLFAALLLLAARYLLKALRAFFLAVERGRVRLAGFYPEWAGQTYKLLRILVLVTAAIAIYPYLPGTDSPAFKGISVFLGVLVSLGSSSSIASVLAGVVLTYTRSFQVGDRVKVGETVGDVVEKTMLVTRIRTIKNVEVTIPNSEVLGSHVLNYTSCAKSRGLILHTTVTIGYDVPWRQVEELLLSAARGTANVLAEPAPFVLQTALNDFNVSYELNAYTDQPAEMVRTYSELHARIQDAFAAAGVEIMSPNYLALRDGNTMTVPAAQRPAGYRAPSFRLEREG